MHEIAQETETVEVMVLNERNSNEDNWMTLAIGVYKVLTNNV